MRYQEIYETKNNFEWLYHISPLKNLQSIKENGLNPEFSRGTKAIYLASDPSHAEGYTNHHNQNGESILLVVNSKKLNKKLLEPDDVDLPDMLNYPDGDDGEQPWWDYTWEESLKLCGQCCYTGIIPSSIISIVDNNGNFISL